jgi:hypothetical protein
MDPFSIVAAAAIVVLVIVIPVAVLAKDARLRRQDPGYRDDRRERTPTR